MPSIEIRETVDVATGPEETFDLVCDFARLVEWDPGVVASRRLTGGRLEEGSRYEVRVRFLGRAPTMDYELLAVERPRSATYQGTAAWLTATDTMTVLPRRGGGATLTAVTAMELVPRLSRLAPVLRPVLERQGRESIARLEAICASRAAAWAAGARG
jgi:hypothetical protein